MKKEFTKDELSIVLPRIERYNPAYNPYFCRYFWDDEIGKENEILGMFKIPDKIYLPLCFRDEVLIGVMLDSTICHELYHCYQYHSQGLIYYSIRNLFKINEIGAKKEENRVDKLLKLV